MKANPKRLNRRRSFKSFPPTFKDPHLHRTDIEILQSFIDHPEATYHEIAEYVQLPPSTLRKRIEHINKRYPSTTRAFIEHQRVGLSPMLLVTTHRPIVYDEGIAGQYKGISWKPHFITQFFIRTKEALQLSNEDLPSTYANKNTQTKTTLNEKPRIWEICYSERKMNLGNYRLFQKRWVFPWLGLRNWVILHAHQPELKKFPPANPSITLWHNPFKMSHARLKTIDALRTKWRTPLRDIAHRCKPIVSITVIHRQKRFLIKKGFFFPYFDVESLQDLGHVLVICRNREGKKNVSIPLTAQSVLQIAREMPGYTFHVLRHIPSNNIEYAIWVDMPWDDIYNLCAIISSIPNSDEIEVYGWVRKMYLCDGTSYPPPSQTMHRLPPLKLFNMEKGVWHKFDMPH
ncbi:MAG: hypothetical protein ACTSVM_00035 [Candidatus Ranarchaeia archaeon]